MIVNLFEDNFGDGFKMAWSTCRLSSGGNAFMILRTCDLFESSSNEDEASRNNRHEAMAFALSSASRKDKTRPRHFPRSKRIRGGGGGGGVDSSSEEVEVTEDEVLIRSMNSYF